MPGFKNINSFEEMVDSRLKIYIYKDSWIWSHFNKKFVYNISLDEKMSKIENQITLPIRDELDYIVNTKTSSIYLFDNLLLILEIDP